MLNALRHLIDRHSGHAGGLYVQALGVVLNALRHLIDRHNHPELWHDSSGPRVLNALRHLIDLSQHHPAGMVNAVRVLNALRHLIDRHATARSRDNAGIDNERVLNALRHLIDRHEIIQI